MAKRYKEWSPTAHDERGLCADDEMGDRYVAPVIQTRDSDTLEVSNFATLRKDLDKDGIEYECHRFGHWGPGWFEILLVEGTDRGEKWCDEWAAALSDYPIADEHDHSERESAAQWESWEAFDRRAVIKWLAKEYALSDSLADYLDTHGSEVLYAALVCEQYYSRGIRGGLTYEGESLDTSDRGLAYHLDRLTPLMLAFIVREVRRSVQKTAAEQWSARPEHNIRPGSIDDV